MFVLKKKPRIILASSLIISLMLTGCASVPELSKDDNDMAAEYLAGTVLKKDKNYKDKLSYERSVLQPTATPEPTEMPAALQQPETTAGVSSQIGEQGSALATTAGAVTESTVQEVSLSEVYGMKGIKVQRISYAVKKSYGSSYAAVTAERNQKLLIVKFRIKNTSSKKQRVNMTKANAAYSLDIDGKNMGSSLVTLIEDDIQFIHQALGTKKSRQAVLIFKIGRSVTIKNTKITVTVKKKKSIISLK